MRKQRLIFPVILILALVLSACGVAAAQAPQQTPQAQQPPLRTLTAVGEAQIKLEPDIAYINIGVHTEDPDAKVAVSNNNTQASKVVNALKSLGIDPKDIQTSNFNIYPQQQYGPNGEMTSVKYVVDNTVSVTVHDLSKLGDILTAATEAGANNVNGIQFDVQDKNAALDQARSQAIANARQTAESMAKAAGVNLGDIQTISYAGNSPQPIYMSFAGKGAAPALDAASVPVSSGQITLTQDVTIVYEIH